jgi:gluconokinase
MPNIPPSEAVPPLVLVIDTGTSWVRAGIYDSAARAIDGWHARRPHPTNFTADGGVEKDPFGTFDLVVGVIDEVLGLAGDRENELSAVAMASLASSLVGVDGAGEPLTPLYLYSDTRPSAEVAVLKSRLDEAAVQQRTGCPIHTSYLPARFLWLALNEPAAYSRAHRWLALSDFIYLRLLGQTATSLSLASWSGLLDHAKLNWDTSLLQILQVGPDHLPVIDESPLIGLTEPYALRWPALASIPWFPGYADGAASNIGSGCGEGSVALSLSTTGALRAVTSSPPRVLPRSLWRYRVDGSRALIGGAINEGGGLLRWAEQTLRLGGAPWQAAASSVEPDSHGLTVLPLLAGERSPGWEAAMRGAIVGLRSDTTAEQIVRALMEAAAYRLAHIARDMRAAGFAVDGIRANGGAAAAFLAWLRIIADVLGRPVEVSGEPEATSRGAAILALDRLGGYRASDAAIGEQVFLPDTAKRQVYDDAMQRQLKLYETLLPWFDRG